MSTIECRLMLFDVNKYREIQPVIEGIINRDIAIDRVVSLFEAARKVVCTDDFKKYNPDWIYEDEYKDLGDDLEMLRNNDISIWYAELDRYNYFDTLESITQYICCPKYQFNPKNRQPEEISGTTVDCSHFLWNYQIYYSELEHSLRFSNDRIEKISFRSGSDGIYFYDRKCLTEFTQAAIEDIDTISRLDTNTNEYDPGIIEKHLKFYDEFNFLLKLANISENYTLLRQYYY
jgi:hypothetical protein